MATPWNQTLVGSLMEAKDRKSEQQRSEANKAKALRAYLGEVDPENKDRLTALGLAELEGLGQAFATKTALAKQQREELKAAQEDRSAAALARVLQDAGTETVETPAFTLPFVRGFTFPATRSTRPVPMTANRLQSVLARNPDAARSENFAPTLNALRALIGDGAAAEQGGLEFVKSPTGAVITREKKTGAFQYDPFSKADAEQNRTRFAVEPIMDRFGRPAGYGVKATFGTEAEAQAWAEKQNGGTSTGTTASQYKDANEVKAALKAGKIKRDEAVKILREQFGYQ